LLLIVLIIYKPTVTLLRKAAGTLFTVTAVNNAVQNGYSTLSIT